MNNVNDLKARIERAFDVVKDKAKQQQQQVLQEHLERQKRLKEYEVAQARVVAIAKPRLEILANRAGERGKVTPSVSHNCREVRFEFKSAKAYITLTFSVSPDQAVKNVVVTCELKIVPVLWKFNSHAEFSMPMTAIDEIGLVTWLDDRIIEFAELFIKIHEEEIYDKAEYVEDPIAQIKFPKFAAGASLEQGGQTYFFIDETTKREFAKKKGVAVS
jgi:YHS domain-containing protein